MSRWSGVIGSTTNAGAIASRTATITAEIPRGPVYEAAVFAAQLVGGASGGVGIQVFANIAGVTIQVAGRTGLTTPGNYQLWSGAGVGNSSCAYVPRPTTINFSGTGTGSSYNATVVMSVTDK